MTVQVNAAATYTIQLTMDEKTAVWLKNYLQNAFQSPEPPEDTGYRGMIWRELASGLRNVGISG